MYSYFVLEEIIALDHSVSVNPLRTIVMPIETLTFEMRGEACEVEWEWS